MGWVIDRLGKMDPHLSQTIPPPPFRKEFTSDAAGTPIDNSVRVGCGNIGFDQNGQMFFAKQIFWEGKSFLEKTDQKGACFGHKTTTLELIGVLLPFLLIPEQLINQHVVVKVDNVACFLVGQIGH
jgi:hypothetical protein